MRITCIIEDESHNPFLKAEHGLSLYIEEANLIFDMGQSNSFIKNAEKFGIEMEKIEYAIISHGHYDHGGGLRYFLDINKTANIYVGRGAFSKRYAKDNNSLRYIGLERGLEADPRINALDSDIELIPGYNIIQDIKDFFPRPRGNQKLFMESNGKRLNDDFKDEIILLIEDENALTIITGCSHRGILNILESVNRRYPKPLRALIGGFHLELGEAEELARTLQGYDIDRIYTGHCTSMGAYKILESELDNVGPLNTGTVIDL